jgi:hypothetical protein
MAFISSVVVKHSSEFVAVRLFMEVLLYAIKPMDVKVSAEIMIKGT